jgi:ABC-type oligopeptide transport system, periplasmic component
MDATPGAVTLVGDELWVAASAPPSTHLGGTLRFASQTPTDGFDPAVSDIPGDLQILSITNDGLVGFDRVGGPQGGTIVPDLATSLPTLSTDGKTYMFQVRPGIHYSNKLTVEPQDFRRSIERVLVNAQSFASYYTGIVGAAACEKRVKEHGVTRCDLSKGIVTDDNAGTISFRLTKPDPEFIYKLALSFADAVPPHTPRMDSTNVTPIPATGPYKIASYSPAVTNKQTGAIEKVGKIELMRNPYFAQWSQAAQPDGYPDQIDGSYGISPANQVSMINHGKLDVTGTPRPHTNWGNLKIRMEVSYMTCCFPALSGSR